MCIDAGRPDATRETAPRRRGWWASLGRALLRDRFLRRLALLSGGTLVGHGIVVLVSPLLTRLYTPEEFGLLGVFTALSGILGSSIALRYDFAVPVVAADDEATDLVAVAQAATVSLTLGLGLVVWWLGPWLADLTNTPRLSSVLWLLPLALLLWGGSLPLTLWSIRGDAYRRVAFNKTLRFLTQGVAQVGLGLLGSGGPGLVLGLVLGYLVSLGHFLLALPATARARLRAVRPARLGELAARHWRYPAFSCSSGLLQSATRFLPTILMAALYGPMVAGWFALAERMLDLPVALLSNTASAVYLGELRGLDSAARRRLFRRTAGRFLLLGGLGMAPLLVAGPGLFALVFGEPWRTAGMMAQYLVAVQLARFVVIPISQTLNVLQRQDLHLLSAGLNLLVLALAFGLGHRLGLSAPTTLLLFSLGSAASYLVYLGLTWRLVLRSSAIGMGQPPA
jgi:O-antigen/teichoic acid export membrane protein